MVRNNPLIWSGGQESDTLSRSTVQQALLPTMRTQSLNCSQPNTRRGRLSTRHLRRRKNRHKLGRPSFRWFGFAASFTTTVSLIGRRLKAERLAVWSVTSGSQHSDGDLAGSQWTQDSWHDARLVRSQPQSVFVYVGPQVYLDPISAVYSSVRSRFLQYQHIQTRIGTRTFQRTIAPTILFPGSPGKLSRLHRRLGYLAREITTRGGRRTSVVRRRGKHRILRRRYLSPQSQKCVHPIRRGKRSIFVLHMNSISSKARSFDNSVPSSACH